ncbi:MAG: aldose 1-epimerase family protein [Culicoidibacterales bacterium]
MITLTNEYLSVTIKSDGAEITSVKDITTNIEYIWQGDSNYWGRNAPVLFPIVGRLTDNKFSYKNEVFELPQHGFARDSKFTIDEQTANKAMFCLEQSAETKKRYPFDFKLIIRYTLIERCVSISWEVQNPSKTTKLPFSIGAHPGFNTTLFDADNIEDYYFEFDKEVAFDAWKLTENGSFGTTTHSLGISDSLRLTPDLFKDDAIVLKTFDFKCVSLKNMRNTHGITMYLQEFKHHQSSPTIAFWSPYLAGGNTPFVCIEPWFGYADTEGGPFDIYEKPGMITLSESESFQTEYSLEFF